MLIPDVLLYAKYNFHLSCLEPIYNELKDLGVNAVLETKRHKIYDAYDQTKKKFPVMVISDEWVNLFRNCADIIITTGHSMVSKNVTFNMKNSEADYICAVSQWHKREFLRRGVKPRKDFLITGYPAADKLFKREIRKEVVGIAYNGNKKILIAPTYNKDLSLVQALCDELVELSKLKDFDIIFKGHPVLPKKYPQDLSIIRGYAEANDHFTIIENTHEDIADYILWSDLFVGDCSGAMILALLNRKPIFAFNNINRNRSEYYDGGGVEWELRQDFAYEFTEFSNLRIMIEEVLKSDWKENSRNSVKDLVYGELQDGKASERIAREIMKMLGG